MHVVIATGIYPPEIGGPATYAKTLAERVSEKGHTVTVVTYGRFIMPSPQFRVVVVKDALMKGVRHAVYFWRVYTHARTADVIYAQDPFSAGFPAWCAAALLRKKFVLKIVGDYAWEQGVNRFGVHELLDEFLQRSYGGVVGFLRKMETFVARHAHHIIVPSNYLQSVVEKWGVSGDRISVVYNAINPVSSPDISQVDARRRIGESVDGHILFSAGRLVSWKGFELLIDLMPAIVRIFPRARLLIAGSGPEYERLHKRAYERGVSDSVRLIGNRSREDLKMYVEASDIFLLNTGYEGFSHQLVEAMMWGAAIITTPSGGNREIVEDRVNALVVPYNEQRAWEQAIQTLLQDDDLRGYIRKGARQTVRRFASDHMVDETLTILAS